MAETPGSTAAASPAPGAASAAAAAPSPPAIKKGSLVTVDPRAYAGSLEASASDPTPPDYLFEGPGEILAIKGDYAQLRWSLPVPDVWLRLDQLRPFEPAA